MRDKHDDTAEFQAIGAPDEEFAKQLGRQRWLEAKVTLAFVAIAGLVAWLLVWLLER